MKAYAFVDGAYLRDKFGECMMRYHGEKAAPDIVAGCDAIKGLAEKVFYYDCVDERQRENETRDDFEDRLRVQEQQFAPIRDLPGWHVREGRLVGAKKQARQKRVDVLLAVEMLSHAFNKNMEKAILYAGDDDFTPLVEELLRHGTYTEVRSDRWVASRHLLHASDQGLRLDYSFYCQIAPESFRQKHPMPEHGIADLPAGGRILKFGVATQHPAKVFDVGGTFHFAVAFPGGLKSLVRAKELIALDTFLLYDFPKREFVPKVWIEPASTT